MKKAFFILILSLAGKLTFAQDIMTVIPDSNGRDMFSDFLGIRLWAADYSLNTINQNLNFSYTSINTGYVMKHSMNLMNLNNTPNLGLGLEEDMGDHLIIHFMDVSFGIAQSSWNWNIGAGAGYFLALDKRRKIRLRISLTLFYESISYGLGSYTDTTDYGFIVNGNNVGTYLNNIKYVDNSLNSSLQLGIMYRTNALDYFATVSWNYVLIDRENIDFYSTRVPINQAVSYQSGAAVNTRVLSPGNGMIQIGIMRDFGL
ncbi:MAG: hypothetical protein ACLQQ4_00860 [Bacteroidia bacterium]